MIGEEGEHIAEPSLGIDVVHATGADQAVHDGHALPATVVTAKHAAISYTSYPSEGPLGGIVGEADGAIAQKKSEAVPAASHVIDRLGDLIVFRKPVSQSQDSRPSTRGAPFSERTANLSDGVDALDRIKGNR